jgi:hypothetical protein
MPTELEIIGGIHVVLETNRRYVCRKNVKKEEKV